VVGYCCHLMHLKVRVQTAEHLQTITRYSDKLLVVHVLSNTTACHAYCFGHIAFLIPCVLQIPLAIGSDPLAHLLYQSAATSPRGTCMESQTLVESSVSSLQLKFAQWPNEAGGSLSYIATLFFTATLYLVSAYVVGMVPRCSGVLGRSWLHCLSPLVLKRNDVRFWWINFSRETCASLLVCQGPPGCSMHVLICLVR